MASLLEETKNCEQPTHEFSSPWDDSDLVLIVENQKLHVHSFMLKMASPVFKAMLSGDFKEKNARELVLPGKKADQFVDFLRQIYPQFDFPMNLENIEHIYALIDEYQTKTVIASCLIALQHIKVTKDNVLRVIDLAQKMGCNEVRQNCYQILNEMPIDEMTTSNKEFMAMDKESLHQVLLPKAKRLEKCLREIQPQFVGVLDCLLFLWGHDSTQWSMKGKPTKCPVHIHSSSQVTAPITERLKCAACVHALTDMATNSESKCDVKTNTTSYFYSCGGMYFDKDIVKVLQEMVDILKTTSEVD